MRLRSRQQDRQAKTGMKRGSRIYGAQQQQAHSPDDRGHGLGGGVRGIDSKRSFEWENNVQNVLERSNSNASFFRDS